MSSGEANRACTNGRVQMCGVDIDRNRVSLGHAPRLSQRGRNDFR